MLGASCYAVTASGAGNQIHSVIDFPYFVNDRQFPFIQRTEILHKADVFLHLFQVTHTGEHHHHTLKPSCITDGITGSGTSSQFIQHRLRLFRQISQMAAFYRFHHNDWFTVLAANFIALAALHGGVFIIQVVKLNLHHFHLGIFGQDLLQHLRSVMKRDTKVPDFALRF